MEGKRKKITQDSVYRDATGLLCPNCGCRDFRVLWTRHLLGGIIRRKRHCRHCYQVIETDERVRTQ